MTNSITRFSNRVANYVKYRPGYPPEVLQFLETNQFIKLRAVIADIGSGTGLSSELFLRKGYTVIGVEPNLEMRDESARLLKNYTNFKPIDGTAENTTLPENSVAMIVAGQAFHWFNSIKTRKEFQRILQPKGVVVLLWNERLTQSEFEQEYEQLIIEYGNQYQKVDHRNIDAVAIADFFKPYSFITEIFSNQQVFDFEGLKGRLLSSSYMPTEQDPGYENMIIDLQKLFTQFETDNHITIHYATKIYVCRFD